MLPAESSLSKRALGLRAWSALKVPLDLGSVYIGRVLPGLGGCAASVLGLGEFICPMVSQNFSLP